MQITRISWWMVLVMNINIMIGAGIFINTSKLIELGGGWASLGYLAVAIVILPLVLSIAELARIYPATTGGMYTYSYEGLGRRWAQVSIISYTTAKFLTIAVLTKALVLYLCELFPFCYFVSPEIISAALLALLTIINLLGMRFGGILQMVFVFFKLTPIMFVIGSGWFKFDVTHFTREAFSFSEFTSIIPVALFALVGFELCSAIGHALEDKGKSLPRIVVGSFLLVALVYTLFQVFLYGVIGNALAASDAPLSLYFSSFVTSSESMQVVEKALLNSLVIVSIIGSCYGVFYSNLWNFFTVLQEMGGDAVSFLRHQNRYGMPIGTAVVQALVAVLAIFSGVGIVAMQRIIAIGLCVSYSVTVFALLRSYKRRDLTISLPRFVPYLALGSSACIAYYALKGLISS